MEELELVTDENQVLFEEWYKESYLKDEEDVDNIMGRVVDNPMFMHWFYAEKAERQFGVLQRYYQETKGWILWVEPYTDKFRIVIRKFWDEKVFSSELINNNYQASYIELLEAADELTNKELED